MTRFAFLAWLLLAPALFPAEAVVRPGRIISLSPNTTEILFGVGAFDRVVGVSQYCTFPPAVEKLPRVGGWQNSSVEKIAALRPDLVVMTEAQVPFIADHLAALGLRSIAVPSQTLEQIFSSMRLIGQATGNYREAAVLEEQTRASLNRVRQRTNSLPLPSVILSVSRTPGTLSDLYVATEGSYLVELISIAGGRSIAAPAKSGYGKMSKEAVLSLNPDVIIDLQHTHNESLGERPQEVWGELGGLNAVRQHRVYTVTDDYAVHASQFVADTVAVFARLLHPEAFPKDGS